MKFISYWTVWEAYTSFTIHIKQAKRPSKASYSSSHKFQCLPQISETIINGGNIFLRPMSTPQIVMVKNKQLIGEAQPHNRNQLILAFSLIQKICLLLKNSNIKFCGLPPGWQSNTYQILLRTKCSHFVHRWLNLHL